MLRHSRFWKGIGPLTLGGLVLGGAAARGEAPPLSRQLTELGRQALAQGDRAQARTFFLKALEIDPTDAEARKASVIQVALQDPAPPAAPAPAPGEAVVPAPPAAPAPDVVAAPVPVPPGPVDARATLEAAAGLENVVRQQLTDDVGRRLQEARNYVNAGQPESALSVLKLVQSVVRSADQVDDATKAALDRMIQVQLLSTVRTEERILAERAEAIRVAASEVQQDRLVRQFEANQATVDAMMTQFDGLMGQGVYNVLYNGGTGDITASTEPFMRAREIAQHARALVPTDPTPYAGMFVSQTMGFLAQELAYEQLKEYRYMLTMQDVARAAVPFPDDKIIEYPEADSWRALSERRIKRYGRAVDLVDRDPKTKNIIAKLDEPISMNFANETPLEEVLKYIKSATAGPNDNGIPIYVDPIGLQDAEKTITSPVTLDLEGVPLKTTLRLMLKQLTLTYTVKDGLLTITSEDSDDQPTEIRVYPVADLAIIPLSLIGGGGGGGGMGGGMGGGGGGMGGGMGGGGMGGGGMGGMGGGGMMSVPVQDPADGPTSSPFLQKKKQLDRINQSAPGAPAMPKTQPPRTAPSGEAGSVVSKPTGAAVQPPPARPAGPPLIAIDPARPGEVGTSKAENPEAYWKEYYRDHDEAPETVRETVRVLNRARKFREVRAALVGYLTAHSDHAEPWMYEALALATKMNGGKEKAVHDALGFAADLAVRSRNPNHLVSVADQMLLMNDLDRAGDLLDRAAELVPHRGEPLLMSINLAQRTSDPKRMGDAIDRLLALGWPGVDDAVRRDARKQAEQLAKALREDGRAADADALLERIPDAEARDLFVRLTWVGDADLELVVDEPLGATARYLTPRTVFGGALVKNGYGSHPEEVYVCPRAFDGTYTIRVESSYNNPDKPAVQATLEIITHEGTPREKKETRTVKLGKGVEPIKITLSGGRRTAALPYVSASAVASPVLDQAKAKAAAKPKAAASAATTGKAKADRPR